MSAVLPSAAHGQADKSTNDRFSLTRIAFGLLGSVAPGLAGRIAPLLFFKPPRTVASERTRGALATGRRFDVELDGGRVSGWSWEPEEAAATSPVVYLVHGWGGLGGQLSSFVPSLVAAGYTVVTFDAPAHGESAGRWSSVLHFSRALRAVAALHGPAHGVVAHSLGGAATVHAMRNGLNVRRVVFVGTPSDLQRYFVGFLAGLGFSRPLQERVAADMERRLGFRWEELSLPRVAPGMSAPLLVFHDRADLEVPWHDGAAIAAAWPGARLISPRDLGHRRILRDPGVVNATVDFLAERSLS